MDRIAEFIGRFRGRQLPEGIQVARAEDPLLAESRLNATRRILYAGGGTLGLVNGVVTAAIADVAFASLYNQELFGHAYGIAFGGNTAAGAYLIPSILLFASAIRNRDNI